MAGIPGIPQNMIVQTANQQNLISWDLSTGATSYIIQRSLDNVTYSILATVSGSPLATQYLDTAVVLGTNYWYKVAAQNFGTARALDTGFVYYSNGTSWNLVFNPTNTLGIPTYANLASFPAANLPAYLNLGTSSYTNPQSATPTPTAEMTLGQLRLASMQRADRVNSNFVTIPEWNNYINQAMFELYDLLITIYEDYYIAPPIQFVADGTTFLYPLPNGSNTFLNALNTAQTVTPPPFYKLMGVDLALNNATNAYVTINKFNFIDRNRFVYPNTASTIYGVFNLQYRVMGSNLEFIPTPTGGQGIRLWYIPRLKELLLDTDITTLGISGWLEYVIVRSAKYALDKEESDSTKLDQELLFLKGRIEESAANRDAGQADKISDTRSNNGTGYGMNGGNGWGRGGWVVALFPNLSMNNSAHQLLTNSIHSSNLLLAVGAFGVFFAYNYSNFLSNLSRRIQFAGMRKFFRTSKFTATFRNHIPNIIKTGSEE